ncbi:MAG TPA: ABC transporter family substrate-binding protein, partial [Homoserinimonas sp.]|nr:ABC transporter family substrate-binding protein [Homoserinimonas sp.]
MTVAVGQSFTSYNPKTAFGSASPTNESIAAATNSSFSSYDETPALVRDESFGSYEVVSTQPLVVTYTVRDGIRWSDGVPIDAADLLLAWAANSTSLNDPEFDPAEFVDPGSGAFTAEFPRDVVYFDGFTGNGLQLVTETPVIGDDGRSITLTFDEYFADWELVFDLGLPAHVVAGKALRITEPQEAKDALVAAVEG